eukprot:6610036-Prymnesium_polylepis.2
MFRSANLDVNLPILQSSKLTPPLNDSFELSCFRWQTADDAAVASTVVDFDHYENIPVQVDGRDFVGGITDFASLSLPPGEFDHPAASLIERNVHLSSYAKPTPIQKHTIPAALQGRDVMACAREHAWLCMKLVRGKQQHFYYLQWRGYWEHSYLLVSGGGERVVLTCNPIHN